MTHTLLYRGWILGRGAAPSVQQIQSIRKGLDSKGVYSIQRLPAFGKHSVTLQPFEKKNLLFPPLLGWSPYAAQSTFPLFSYAVNPKNQIHSMTDLKMNPYRISYGDWSMVANFPAEWYPSSDDLAVIPSMQ